MEKPDFKHGMSFRTIEKIWQAISEYEVQKRVKITKTRNENVYFELIVCMHAPGFPSVHLTKGQIVI